jgi:hypothetical protein
VNVNKHQSPSGRVTYKQGFPTLNYPFLVGSTMSVQSHALLVLTVRLLQELPRSHSAPSQTVFHLRGQIHVSSIRLPVPWAAASPPRHLPCRASMETVPSRARK